MAKRTGGTRRKTRNILKKPLREKGKLSLTRYFQAFDAGEKVLLMAEPSVQKGLYHGRFHAKIAIILRKKRTCYEVQIDDVGKKKTLVVHPVHLRKIHKEKPQKQKQ